MRRINGSGVDIISNKSPITCSYFFYVSLCHTVISEILLILQPRHDGCRHAVARLQAQTSRHDQRACSGIEGSFGGEASGEALGARSSELPAVIFDRVAWRRNV